MACYTDSMNNAPLKRRHWRTLGLIAVFALVAGILFSYNLHHKNKAISSSQMHPLMEKVSATLYPTPREIRNFSLINQYGKPFHRDDLKGQWTFVFFGFTHCPDICPETLAIANQLLNQIPDNQVPTRFLLVTVDPERDTPEVLHSYLDYFSPKLMGATGDKKEIEELAASMGAVFMKASLSDTYTVDHTGSLFLLNPDARLQGVFQRPFSASQIAADFILIREVY